MDNLIDERYFFAENKIAGLNISTNTSLPNQYATDKLELLRNYYIPVYQEQYLKEMFGDTIAALEELPVVILNMIVDEEHLRSPLANYVFCMYMLDKERGEATNTGSVRIKTANTENISMHPVISRSWNLMVAKNLDIHYDLYKLVSFNGYSYIEDIESVVNYHADLFQYSNGFGI